MTRNKDADDREAKMKAQMFGTIQTPEKLPWEAPLKLPSLSDGTDPAADGVSDQATIPPRVPVSQETVDALLVAIRRKPPTPGVLRVEKSQKPAEIIFVTTAGTVACQVTEDDLFVFLELPSGRRPSPCWIK